VDGTPPPPGRPPGPLPGPPVSPPPRPPRWATLVATVGGAGRSPKAPGTVGALVALPLAWGLSTLPLPARLGVLGLLTLVALLGTRRYLQGSPTADPPEVVVDELLGQLLTLLPFAWSLPRAVAGLVLFRLCDILKPWPIGWLDRRPWGAAAVLLDDLAAGLAAAGLLLLLETCA